ncbi:MAG: hypothetical protein IKQ23_09685 [Treponema sp.]|nr:hypothetical protein [Treponema sp.]
MASTVAWYTPNGEVVNKWMADNCQGEQHLFNSKEAAIQSACDMERSKPNPDRVLIYKENGGGFADIIYIKK